ncbi:helix-turn-helix transcriptional regulator [Pseudochelatococcus sp. B33]
MTAPSPDGPRYEPRGLVTNLSETVPGTWRDAVDRQLEELGWRQRVRVERPDETVTIYAVDTPVPKDVTFSASGPPTFSISVFLDGRGTLAIDGAAPLHFSDGTAALFASNGFSSGTDTILATAKLRFVDIRFEIDHLLKLGGLPLARFGGALLTEYSVPESGIFLIGFPAHAALARVASEMLACRMDEGLARRLYLYSRSVEALSIVVSTLENAAGSLPALRPDEQRKIANARRLLEESYPENWTIARLSREVGLNERQLKQGFRRIVGNSIHAYLKEVRLNAAASLLLEGRSVTEVALSVGFESLSHFSKVFREARGTSPSRYRG